MSDEQKECEHRYVFQGTVYSTGDYTPGSGARHMIYEDLYFCEKCLTRKYTHSRIMGNNYFPPAKGTTPK
jgi:hypothetical protein